MLKELSKYLVEDEDPRDAQILIYQDNIQEVTNEIDKINVQLRSLMESHRIDDMVGDGTVNEQNYDNAKAGYALLYKDLFGIRDQLNESLTALVDLLKEVTGEDVPSGSKIETEE